MTGSKKPFAYNSLGYIPIWLSERNETVHNTLLKYNHNQPNILEVILIFRLVNKTILNDLSVYRNFMHKVFGSNFYNSQIYSNFSRLNSFDETVLGDPLSTTWENGMITRSG